MNEIQVLQRTTLLGKELTVYGNAENPLFLAKDVAEWIEYDVSSLNKLVNTVDEDERLVGTLFRIRSEPSSLDADRERFI